MKGIPPVKTEWWDVGMVMYLGQGADLHMAQLMPLPLTISCFSKSRLVLPSWWYLSGVGSPGESRTKSKMAIKRLCVCVLQRNLQTRDYFDATASNWNTSAHSAPWRVSLYKDWQSNQRVGVF